MTNGPQPALRLLERSAAWYRALPRLQGRAVLHVPQSAGTTEHGDTGTFDYALGPGTDASFTSDGYGGTALGHNVYLIRSDRPGIYVRTALHDDLPTTMLRVLGAAMFVPPQIVMRAGRDLEAIVEAMGLGLITGLKPEDAKLGSDSAESAHEEITFHGEQGSVTARFARHTAALLRIELAIGNTRFSYDFTDETIVAPDKAVRFDAGDRRELASFSGITGGPAAVGDKAPDFTLDSIDGPPRSLSRSGAQAVGTRLILDFWALWCAPCLQAMPRLDALAQRLAAGPQPIEVWTIALIESADEAGIVERMRALWAEKGLTLPVLIDRDGLIAQEGFAVRSLPTTVIIDAQGVVELMQPGFEPEALEAWIKSH